MRTWTSDFDGDGDIDLCTKPWKDGNEHLFFRNRLKDSTLKTGRSRAARPIAF